MKSDSKIHIAGISAIIIVIIASIWMFTLSDNIFNFVTGVNTGKSSSNSLILKLLSGDSTPKEESQVATESLPGKVKQEEQKKPEPIEPKSTEPKIIKTKDIPKIKKQVEPLSPIELLEKEYFYLEGSGTAYEVTPKLSKSASIKLKLTPIIDSKLTQFDITYGKIVIAGSAINVDDGHVSIEGNTITINFKRNESHDPYLDMTGTMSNTILEDKNEEVGISFKEQLLYLTKDENTPYHLNFDTYFGY